MTITQFRADAAIAAARQAVGDTVVAFFDAEGTARDDKPYRNTYSWFLRMRDGRIVEAHALFDSIAFDDFWKRVTPASN